jgi:hypothetical protein
MLRKSVVITGLIALITSPVAVAFATTDDEAAVIADDEITQIQDQDQIRDQDQDRDQVRLQDPSACEQECLREDAMDGEQQMDQTRIRERDQSRVCEGNGDGEQLRERAQTRLETREDCDSCVPNRTARHGDQYRSGQSS